MSARTDAIKRIAHDLCDLMDDEWSLGRKLYLSEAKKIYDREIAPLVDKKFTLYWRAVQREVITGRTRAAAFTQAGYGAGAMAALDFHADGDNHEYEWNSKSREWVKK